MSERGSVGTPRAATGGLRERLRPHLEVLYPERADATLEALLAIVADATDRHGAPAAPLGRPQLDEARRILITYADAVRSPDEPPLVSLRRFLRRHVRDAFSDVHLLPFYPSSSDDGFSVIDYLAVDPAVGSWEDVERLGQDYGLMFDAVLNHVSVGSRWFQGFLRGEERYRDYFISVDPATDLSGVVRPRTSPLLTRFDTAAGPAHVWTTFSADQVDLDYRTPEVLLELVRVLLGYVARGATILRLDAVTYLWKEVGTSCVHHPNTHRLLRLLRTVIDAVDPRVALLTETNVPHHENVSYFGTGHDEAHMVYNFALPPLVLHAFARRDTSVLQSWAATLSTPSDATCFFNFLASHDGIGLRPVEHLLPSHEVDDLVERVQARGGLVSHRSDGRGGRSPYELNVALYDALADVDAGEPPERAIDRFACAHALMLSLAGVPAVYLHSLFGTPGDHEAVRASGHARAVNRAKLRFDRLQAELEDAGSRSARVLARLTQLLRVRGGESGFHPAAEQRVLDLGPERFALLRVRGGRRVLAVHDVGGRGTSLELAEVARSTELGDVLVDLISGTEHRTAAHARLDLAPYGVAWLAAGR